MLILIINDKFYVDLWEIILYEHKLNMQNTYKVSITSCYEVS